MSDFDPSLNGPLGAPRERLEEALSALVDRYGLALLNDPGTLKLHLDQAGADAPASTSQLMLALADEVPQQLLSAHSDDDLALLLPRLVGRLAARDGFDPSSAAWAIRSWAHALALPATGLDGPVPRAPAAPPPRAVDFAAIVTPRSDSKPAAPRPLVEGRAAPVPPPSPAVPAGDLRVSTSPDPRAQVSALAPADQHPNAATPPGSMIGSGVGAPLKPAAVPSGIPAGTSGRLEPDANPLPQPLATDRAVRGAPLSPARPVGEAPVPAASDSLSRYPASASPSDRTPSAATSPDPVVADGVGHEPLKPAPGWVPRKTAVPHSDAPQVPPVRPEADATLPTPASGKELRAARPLGYLPPTQSAGRPASKRRGIVIAAVLVAIAVIGVVIGRSRTSEAPVQSAGVAADPAATTSPPASTPSSTTSATAAPGTSERADAPAASAPAPDPAGRPAVSSASGTAVSPAPGPSAPDPSPLPAAPAVATGAASAPAPVQKPPVIARIDVPRVVIGKPFTIALTVDRTASSDLATVERRVVDSTIPWPTPVKVTPVSTLGRSRSGALIYPVDGIQAASTTTLQFTLIDRKGVRSSPRRVSFRIESAAPATVAAATCARSTCGSVASVRELEPARAGDRARSYEVIIRMDDRSIQTAIMSTRPRSGARLQKIGNQFVTPAADRR